MKKYIILISILILSIQSKSQNKNIFLGAGLGYSSDINSMGIDINGIYQFTNKWESSGKFTYMFEKDLVNWSILDLDAHYILFTQDKLNIYGLAGLNFTFWKIEFNTIFNDFLGESLSESGTETGLNIGAGVRYHFKNKIYFTPELKYTIGGFNYLTINIGVNYKF